jgi:hypothetical protein
MRSCGRWQWAYGMKTVAVETEYLAGGSVAERGAVLCPSITWSVDGYPALVHILVYRIPFTRKWTIWTTTSGLQSGRVSNE